MASGKQRAIPGIFLSHEPYIEAAIFCLHQYARLWPDCPIHFLIPVNSESAAQRFRESAPRTLSIEIVRTGAPIRETLRQLDRAAGDSEWIYWCGSDRYPTAAVPRALFAIAEDMSSAPADGPFADVQAVRFVRWKDFATINANEPPRAIGGETFRPVPMSLFGFWHPQFMSRRWLRQLVDSMDANDGVREMQVRITTLLAHNQQRPVVCSRPLMKLEEPIRAGFATINYAARQARKGADVDGLKMEGAVVSFSSPSAPAANAFWRRHKLRPETAFTPLPGEAPYRVISPGGVGSKRLVTWLYPEASVQERGSAHWHNRVPPPRLNPGERCIYVFGDPRNITLSIFNRRNMRHERHGFLEVNELRDAPMPEFAMLHARNLQVDSRPMSQEWDLEAYLAHGEDIFRLEEHFDFWLYADAPYEVVFARYETLWQNAKALQDHLDVPRPLPEFHPRASDWNTLPALQREQIDGLYGAFARRLETLPDAFSVRQGVVTALDGSPMTIEAI